jgi:hypothetical protein
VYDDDGVLRRQCSQKNREKIHAGIVSSYLLPFYFGDRRSLVTALSVERADNVLELRRLRVKLVSLLIWAKPFYTRILGRQEEAPVYREMPFGI